MDFVSLDYRLDGADLVSGDEAARLLGAIFENAEDKPVSEKNEEIMEN